MPRTKIQWARLEVLDRMIRDGEFPNCFSFAKKWEVSYKTVQRDIDYMRDQMGSPVVFDRDRNGFRYTHQQWFLPHTAINEGDLFSLRIASRALEAWYGRPMARELTKIRGRLMEGFAGRVTLHPDADAAPLSFAGPPVRKIADRVWDVVVKGLLDRRAVQATYQSAGATTTTERTLQPYHMANLQGEWYVFGHDSRSGEVRQFSLARIRRASLTTQHFQVPKDFDPQKLLEGVFGRFVMTDKTYDVRLEFAPAVAPWVTERLWHPRQKLEVKQDGGVELTFPTKGLFEVHRWVLAWGSHCRVLAPKQLKTMVEDEVRTMYAHLETKMEGAPA